MGNLLSLGVAAARLDQGDTLFTEGTTSGFVSDNVGAVAGKERDAQVGLLGGTENEHADANDNAAQFFNGSNNVADRPAERHNVVNDQDFFARSNSKAATEDATGTRLVFFGKDAADAELPGSLVSQDNAGGGGTSDDLYAAFTKMVGNHAAEFLGIFGVLDNQ